MTMEIGLTFAVLLLAVILFVTELIRADLVALLVLVILVLVGLITPEDSIAGFSNPAVITTWSVFILSAGLGRTGVAAKLADYVLHLAGKAESRLLAVLMSSTAAVSAFVINVGVAAIFLPVTLNIANRTGRSASKLLMPMVQGTTVGGMLVLIGTASNLVVVEFLREAGMRVPGLFDFTPVGIVILVVSIIYMILIGRRLLPARKTPSVDHVNPRVDYREHYDLQERLALINIPPGNQLAGKTLLESRFGRALGLNVLSIIRDEGVHNLPDSFLELKSGDQLLVLGRLDMIDELSGKPVVVIESEPMDASCLVSDEIGLIELEVDQTSVFNGKSLVELDARNKMGLDLLAVYRNNMVRRTNLQDEVFKPGDRLLFRGRHIKLESLQGHDGFCPSGECNHEKYNLDERLLYLRIPKGSPLVDSAIKDIRLPRAYGISILKIVRGKDELSIPNPGTRLKEDDLLLVEGRPVDIEVLRGHQTMGIERNPDVDLKDLETDTMLVVEVMLSPHSSITGKTLAQLNFREKFGISVLAIWRGDRAYRTGLNDRRLEFGDTLLCLGTREKYEVLSRDPDYVILDLDYREKPLVSKAPVAGLIMLGVLLVTILNWLPIYVAAIAGALLMIVTRCLSVEEAYRAIEWKAVFLIAAMLPLGMSMQQTGAAALVADTVIGFVGRFGPTAILAALMILTMILNQFIPSAVNAVVMTPIAMATALGMGLSPYPFVMGIAYSVAASFMTPVSHPANVLIMSPGGYRFSDYVKNGFPLVLIVLVVSVLLLPLVFPY